MLRKFYCAVRALAHDNGVWKPHPTEDVGKALHVGQPFRPFKRSTLHNIGTRWVFRGK